MQETIWAVFFKEQSDVNLCSVLPWLVFILHKLIYNHSIKFVLYYFIRFQRMAALAVSFGFPFRETFDFAL